MLKTSPDRYRALPSRTSCGPPPIAASTPGQAGRRESRTVVDVPTGASEVSAVADSPRATRTAPPGGIATEPPSTRSSSTGATRSTSGVAAGNGKSTTATLPGIAGVSSP